MSGVNLDLESLVDAERADAHPSQAERDRMRRMLAAKLGATAFATSGIALGSSAQVATAASTTPAVSASIATTGTFGTLKLATVIALSTALATTGATMWSRGRVPARQAAVPVAHVHPSPAPAPPRVERSTARSATASDAPRPDDSSQLLDEATLLGRARESLRAGDATRALALLDAYRTRFPHGDLVVESDAARAISLCTLGRTGEGAALAHRIANAHPESPLAARAVSRCTR